MLLKPAVDMQTEEELDEYLEEIFELDESEDLGLRYPDGRYHIYEEALKQVIEVHPDGRRFIMLQKGYSVERGPEIL